MHSEDSTTVGILRLLVCIVVGLLFSLLVGTCIRKTVEGTAYGKYSNVNYVRSVECITSKSYNPADGSWVVTTSSGKMVSVDKRVHDKVVPYKMYAIIQVKIDASKRVREATIVNIVTKE